MSKQDSAEQVKFLVCCIRNSTNGKPDFTAVAEQFNIVTKAAAKEKRLILKQNIKPKLSFSGDSQKRYERMLKTHGADAPKAVAANEGGPEPATPVKRKLTRGASTSARKKIKEKAASDGSQAKKMAVPQNAVNKRRSNAARKEVTKKASDSENETELQDDQGRSSLDDGLLHEDNDSD